RCRGRRPLCSFPTRRSSDLGGAQNGGLDRYGDYSAMSIDPIDDCTFWYTQEYIATGGSFNWHTRIGSFRIGGCSTGGDVLLRVRSEEHTSELQSQSNIVCRL